MSDDSDKNVPITGIVFAYTIVDGKVDNKTNLNPTANLSVDQNLIEKSSNEGGLFLLVSNLIQFLGFKGFFFFPITTFFEAGAL